MVVLASPKTDWYRLTDSRYRAAYARQVTNTAFTPTFNTAERQMYSGGSFPITFDYVDTITDIVMTLHQLTSLLTYINRNFVVTLTENSWACAISIANPAVVTKVWHGLTTGQYIQLTTTWALPTWVSSTNNSVWGNSSYLYAVRVINADTFYLYNSDINAIAWTSTGRIVTSWTQSWVHTLWKSIAQVEKTPTQIMWVNHTTTRNHYWYWNVNFELSSPVSVTTDSGKYKLNVNNLWDVDTTVSWFWVWYWAATGINVLNAYIIWQTQLNPVNWQDFYIFRNSCILDHSRKFYPFRSAPTWLTNNNGMDWIVCTMESDFWYENDVMIDIPPTISSKISIEFQSWFLFSNKTWFRIGLENNKMPYNMLEINRVAVANGTTAGIIRWYADIYVYWASPAQNRALQNITIPPWVGVTISSITNKATANSIYLTEWVPVYFITNNTLPAPLVQWNIYFLRNKSWTTYDIYDKDNNLIDITSGGSGTHTANVCLSFDESQGWAVWDYIFPWQDQTNAASTNLKKIADKTSDWKIFSLDSAWAIYLYQPWTVIKNCKYWYGVQNNYFGATNFTTNIYNHFHIEWYTGVWILIANTVADIADANHTTPVTIKKCFMIWILSNWAWSQQYTITSNAPVPVKWYDIDNVDCVNMYLIWQLALTNYRRIDSISWQFKNFVSWTVKIRNCFLKSSLIWYATTGAAASIKWDVEWVEYYNNVNQRYRTWVGSIFKNNKTARNACANPGAWYSPWHVVYWPCVNVISEWEYIDGTNGGNFDIWFNTGATIAWLKINNLKMNTLIPQTSLYNIFTDASVFVQADINNPSSDLTIYDSYQDNMQPWSYIRQNAIWWDSNLYMEYLQKWDGDKDVSIRKNWTSSLKVTTTQSWLVELPSISFVAKSWVTYKIPWNFRYDSNFESWIIQYPKISISDWVITPVTFTAYASLPDTWQPFLLEITQSSGVDTIMSIDIIGGSTDATGKFWIDWIAQYPYINATRFYWYKFDEGSITKTIDPIIVLNETWASALSSKMSMDFWTNTLTISDSVSLSNIYDFIKYSLCLPENLSRNDIISSPDGVIFNGSFNLNLTSTAQITGGWTLTISANTLSIASGATSTAQLVSDDASFTSLSVSGLIAGSRIQLYNVTDDVEIYNAIVAGTSWSTGIAWTTDKTIRLRVIKNDWLTAYQMFESTGTFLQTGLAFNASQLVNGVYNANNIDGSIVTECSISGTIVRIYVDDPDNLTTWQRIYNWYQSYLSTEAGIREQSTTYFYAIDSTTYKCSDTMRIINQDTVNPLAITGGNCSPVTAVIQNIVDTSNGASIVVLSDRVVDASWKIAWLATKKDVYSASML